MTHKFRDGQSVYLATRTAANASRGTYRIVRALPVERDDRRRYRIKSTTEAFERIADEYELSGLE